MTGDPEDDGAEGRGYASPACSLHEIDPAWMGFAAGMSRAEILAWRKLERERLIAARLALTAEERQARDRAIEARLDALLGDVAGVTISAYWPFRGEPDLRAWLGARHAAGARCALPVVVERGRPLVFREWRPGARLERGIWNIPIPAEGAEVTPDVVIAPVVGFDTACRRLGYGGGFFDRTLAAMTRKPRAIGVGHSGAAIPTIHPLPHDIPMDLVLTEREVVRPGSE
jgi:5,10-methenyltetrahydrofolate synthetase